MTLYVLLAIALIVLAYVTRPGAYQKPTTLYIGDSFVYNWRTPPGAVNAGYGGYTCNDVLNKFRTLYAGEHWDTIVLWCGTNDIGAGLSSQYYRDTIVQMLWDFGAMHPNRVIVMGIAPPGKSETGHRPLDRVKAENDWLLNTVNTMPVHYEIMFIDVSRAAAPDGGVLPDELTDDDIHLNDAGYALVDKLTAGVLP